MKRQDVTLHTLNEKHISSHHDQQLYIGWYFWLIAQYPVLIIILCAVIASVFSFVGVTFSNIPDFSDPSQGFEIRGTKLGNKLITWRKLLNETGNSLPLSIYPYTYFRHKAHHSKNADKPGTSKNSKIDVSRERRFKRSSVLQINSSGHSWDFVENGYFCDNPNMKYANWIFKLHDDAVMSLWSAEGLRSICEHEKLLLSHPQYENVCIRLSLNLCCPVISVPNFVAYFAGLKSCENITRDSIVTVEETLRRCAKYYCNGALKSDCWQSATKINTCPSVPKVCVTHNAMFHFFFFMVENSVVCPFSLNTSLKYSTVFIPAFKHRNLLPIYYDNFQSSTPHDVTKVSSIDFDLKILVFEMLLFSDTMYPMIAMGAVGVIICFYTESLFIPIMCLISTVASMFVSYFFYTIVLDFKYFPFMNLSALLVMVGLSADNVLVYYTAFSDYIDDDKHSTVTANSTLKLPVRVGIVTKTTLRHVAWSLLVTGLTTAAAFFANYSSQVTAVKCFGVYTGLTVVTNMLLCLSWLPAVIVLHHKYFNYSCTKFFCFKCCVSLHRYWLKLCNMLSEISRIFFHQIQVLIVVRLRYFWVLLYFILAICGAIVVFVHPRFKLPSTSSYFQYFRTSHPFEAYVSEIQKFAFQNRSSSNFPIRIIFGVNPSDSGDSRNPYDTGDLSYQSNFNLSHPESQAWLMRFCQMMRNTSLYRRNENEQLYSACFIETLKKWVDTRDCHSDPVCCWERNFPYDSAVFEHCLKEAVYQLSITPGVRLYPSTPGPRFDKDDRIRVLISEFESTLPMTSSFEEVENFYNEMGNVLEPVLADAPVGLQGGWFVSDLRFYALQDALYRGMTSSVSWSLLVALLVILITSRNIFISVFASLTIAGIIFVTSASLVFLGWELNVLESVTVSIAVGLSVDFTAHFAIAYMVAMPTDDRLQRVEFCIARMGPAITLAALTSIVAGVGMCPANVLAYSRFGLFLVIVMLLSWLYSSYFFLGLLSICGPQNERCIPQCKSAKYVITSPSIKNESSRKSDVIEYATVTQ